MLSKPECVHACISFNIVVKKAMDWLCSCLRGKPAYRKVSVVEEEGEEVGPAKYVSASLDSEYDLENFHLKSTVSSIYKKMSEWSLPKRRKLNLFTLNEDEHDFLMNEYSPENEGGSPSPCSSTSSPLAENFDDVVDGLV